MDTLRINLLGPLEVFAGVERLPPFPTKRAERLFAFLALNRGRAFPRDRLADQMGEEVREAVCQHRFRNAVWRMRAVVERPGVPRGTYFCDRARTLGLNPSAVCSTDVEEFERLVASPGEGTGRDDGAPLCVRLHQALALYRGNLCEGDEAEWCLAERERLRGLFLAALGNAAECCASQGNWYGAIAWCERVLLADPLREQLHRDLICYHYLAGDRAAALAQYERVVKLLWRELHVAPMRETVELDAAIRAGRPIASPEVVRVTVPSRAGRTMKGRCGRRIVQPLEPDLPGPTRGAAVPTEKRADP